ncbi:hypothetical protein ATE76_18940 [Sphingopyxis sp. H093]|nr:hypothetical protein ATE76_18940 [Sphingopyxis sp. H093]
MGALPGDDDIGAAHRCALRIRLLRAGGNRRETQSYSDWKADTGTRHLYPFSMIRAAPNDIEN